MIFDSLDRSPFAWVLSAYTSQSPLPGRRDASPPQGASKHQFCRRIGSIFPCLATRIFLDQKSVAYETCNIEK